jgi:serine/threonine-protein kinase
VGGSARGAERREAGARVPAERRGAGYGTELRGAHRFRLMKRLGQGRFGSVFLARRLGAEDAPAPPERVAVKVFSERAAEGSALRRELAALRAIQHARVPALHDFCLEGRHAFVAMDYFEHGSLAPRVVAGERPDEDEVWRLLEHLLEALAVAHQASLLHLDVKPSNVLLAADGGFALSDFGISECARAGGVAPRARGTAGYRAPEQHDGRYRAVDARSDLFGAGATVWAFATGLDLARRRRLAGSETALPPLDSLRPDLSRGLAWLVDALLRVDPDGRPASACEALARLRAILREAVPPRPLLALAGERVDAVEAAALVAQLVDPLAAHVCRDPLLRARVVRLAPGELLWGEGETSDAAVLLLRGRLVVERGGRAVARVSREGELLGEVAALLGRPRTASLSAEGGPAWVCLLNAAQFEALVASQPGLALRLLRAMAERYAAGAPRD